MIPEKIEILCKQRGLSVSGLEKQLGFGNSTISKWAKSSPTVEKIMAVADYFGITVDELLSIHGKENAVKEFERAPNNE